MAHAKRRIHWNSRAGCTLTVSGLASTGSHVHSHTVLMRAGLRVRFSPYLSLVPRSMAIKMRSGGLGKDRRLGGGAEFLRAFGPMGFETRVGNAGVTRNVGVADNKIIFRAGLEEFLLQRFPRRFVQPQMNFRNLIAH